MLSRLYSGSDREQKSLSHICQNYLQDSFWPYEEFKLSLKIPQTFLIFRAEEDEDWQGFALARVIGGVSELFYIYVRPEMRGRKLAPQLLNDMEVYSLEKLNAESVMLEVRPSNIPAIRLYEKSGYERIHVRKRYYQDGEDALIYNKVLIPAEGSV